MDRRHALVAVALSAVPLSLGAAGPVAAVGDAKINRKLLQAFLDALTTHDLEKFKSLYVPNGYIQHQTRSPSGQSQIGS